MNVKRLLLLFLILLLAGCDSTDEGVIEAAGVVEATTVTIAPALGGQVMEIFVSEGDTVAAGDALFRLEDAALTAQRDQAVATVGAAEAGLDTARATVGTVSASMSSAEAGVEAAEANVVVAVAAVNLARAAGETALAGVEIANVQYQAVLAGVRIEERPARAVSWEESASEEFSTPPWYFHSEETMAAAQVELDAATEALNVQLRNFRAMVEGDRFADFHVAETRLAESQASFLVAEGLRDKQISQTGSDEIDVYVQSIYDAALTELEVAQLSYDQLLDSDEAITVLDARSQLATTTERHELALDRVTELMTGEGSFAMQAAGAEWSLAENSAAQAVAAVTQAEAMVDAAQTAVTVAESSKEQIEAGIVQAETAVVAAEKMVEQAQAVLDLVDIQMERLLVKTAVSGTIMTRNVEMGELVRPGMSAMSIGQLDDLRVTVYIPESKYGQINLGDTATLMADSFPDETFDVVVTRIADQAEFTPRNVQTKEERQTTVYAIELSVTDPDGKLKPGMPADVVFGE